MVAADIAKHAVARIGHGKGGIAFSQALFHPQRQALAARAEIPVHGLVLDLLPKLGIFALEAEGDDIDVLAAGEESAQLRRLAVFERLERTEVPVGFEQHHRDRGQAIGLAAEAGVHPPIKALHGRGPGPRLAGAAGRQHREVRRLDADPGRLRRRGGSDQQGDQQQGRAHRHQPGRRGSGLGGH